MLYAERWARYGVAAGAPHGGGPKIGGVVFAAVICVGGLAGVWFGVGSFRAWRFLRSVEIGAGAGVDVYRSRCAYYNVWP